MTKLARKMNIPIGDPLEVSEFVAITSFADADVSFKREALISSASVFTTATGIGSFTLFALTWRLPFVEQIFVPRFERVCECLM